MRNEPLKTTGGIMVNTHTLLHHKLYPMYDPTGVASKGDCLSY